MIEMARSPSDDEYDDDDEEYGDGVYSSVSMPAAAPASVRASV